MTTLPRQKTQRFTLDDHKLLYHPERLHRWMQGEPQPPLYVEIGPINRCNYRCSFCALDYTGYRGEQLATALLQRTVEEMAGTGVKSIMFAGAGEPLLHPNITEIVSHTAANGLDVAITTNGALLTPEYARHLLPSLSWIRISCNAGTAGEYAAVHGCDDTMFEKVLANLAGAVTVKREQELGVTIGVQCVLLGENLDHIQDLAVTLKRIGVDYLSVKPFSRHPLSNNHRLGEAHPTLPPDFIASLASLTDSRFHVSMRTNALVAVEEDTVPFTGCLGLDFFCTVDAGGGIYPCHSYMNVEGYCYGNLNESSFTEIWSGERKKRITEQLRDKLGRNCRRACRLDRINRFLQKLATPPEHVNFI